MWIDESGKIVRPNDVVVMNSVIKRRTFGEFGPEEANVTDGG